MTLMTRKTVFPRNFFWQLRPESYTKNMLCNHRSVSSVPSIIQINGLNFSHFMKQYVNVGCTY